MSKIVNTKKKRIIAVICLIISLLLISFLYYKIYSIYHIGIPCIFHRVTGLYCPGCGITRALFALISGNIKIAIHNNILIFILAPFLIYYFIKKIKIWISFEKETKILPNKLLYGLLIITLLFGILRNFELFDFLQPLIIIFR